MIDLLLLAADVAPRAVTITDLIVAACSVVMVVMALATPPVISILRIDRKVAQLESTRGEIEKLEEMIRELSIAVAGKLDSHIRDNKSDHDVIWNRVTENTQELGKTRESVGRNDERIKHLERITFVDEPHRAKGHRA